MEIINAENINFVDMIIIAVICFCMIRGIFRGLTSEIFSIISLTGGFYGAYLFYPRVARFLPGKIQTGLYADIVSFACIFCAAVIVINILGILIRFALGIIMLGWVDRLLGAGFGAVKGALFVSVLLFMVTSFYPSKISGVKQSVLCGYAAVVSDTMTVIVSDKFSGKIKLQVKELSKVWKKRDS